MSERRKLLKHLEPEETYKQWDVVEYTKQHVGILVDDNTRTILWDDGVLTKDLPYPAVNPLSFTKLYIPFDFEKTLNAAKIRNSSLEGLSSIDNLTYIEILKNYKDYLNGL